MTVRNLVVVACLLTAMLALPRAQSGQQFAFERPIQATGPGPHRLVVDGALMSGADPFEVRPGGARPVALDGLADLRLYDSHGQPVPYLLIHPPSAEPRWIEAALSPLAATEKTSGFEADLGGVQPVDRIRVMGLTAPFLKRLVLEGSGDRERWTLLAAEGTLFDLPGEDLRQVELGFETGAFRYLRVTWDDTHSGRVGMPGSLYAREGSRMPPPQAAMLDAGFERRSSEPGRSRYRVRLPAPRMPAVALDFDVGGGHVNRQAVVTESRLSGTEAVPAELGRAMLTRVVRHGLSASALRVPIAQPAEAELDLVIEDGVNPPLDVRRVSVVLAELPWIYFEAPAGALVARYGDRRLEPPAYDLEAVRTAVRISDVPEAAWGEPQPAAERSTPGGSSPTPDAGAPLDAGAFRYVRDLQEGSAGLVALSMDAAALAHSRGPTSRFADVRVLDPANRQVPYLVERRDDSISMDVRLEPAGDLEAPELQNAPGRTRSIHAVTLPHPSLPRATLVLETSARVFQRAAQLGLEQPPDRRHRTPWFNVVAAASWQHADPDTPAPALSLSVPTLEATRLLIVVDEGDNAALPVTSARLLLPSYRLRFFHPADTTLRLAYGRSDLQPPRYDLALLAPQVMGAAAREIDAESERADPSIREPRRLISPLVFWILLGGAVLVILGLIVRLLRTNTI